MKVKVCGITEMDQFRQLEKVGADFAGMIFYPHSARFVGTKLDKYKEEIKKLSIQTVGVFVNADIKEVLATVAAYGLKYVQLHGNETPEYCSRLLGKVPTIKAVRVLEETTLNDLVDPYRNVCDYILFDTGAIMGGGGEKSEQAYGGTGKKFDWAKLTKLHLNKHFFLSGGIELDDVMEIKLVRNPFLYAVDINSRFETEPGVKNMLMIQEFISDLKG